MSWANRYRLPWQALDPTRIEAAVQHVAAGFSPCRTSIEAHGPGRLCCYFEVSAGEEFKWDLLGDVEERFCFVVGGQDRRAVGPATA